MNDYKRALEKIGLTPEGFFRLCDVKYQQEISEQSFFMMLEQYDVVLQSPILNRLIAVLDEDGNSMITLDEYYGALETYQCRVELDSPYGAEGVPSYQKRTLIKFVNAMRQREMTSDELFDQINSDGNDYIDLEELRATLNKFGTFNEK